MPRCRKGIRSTGATMIPHLPQLQPRTSTWFGDPTLLGDPPDSTHWSLFSSLVLLFLGIYLHYFGKNVVIVKTL